MPVDPLLNGESRNAVYGGLKDFITNYLIKSFNLLNFLV